jgi:hypothetical protein
MKIPGFTAEDSLYQSSENCQTIYADSSSSTRIAEPSADRSIVPQAQRIVCARSGGRIHCGIEDDVLGMSWPLF